MSDEKTDGGQEPIEKIIERRIDRRLKRIEEGDIPWTRRIVGGVIILISFYFGWQLLNSRARQAEEEHQKTVRMRERNPERAAQEDAAFQAKADAIAAAKALPPQLAAPLPENEVRTISDCTKGVDAFRNLSLKKENLTLSEVFAPVLDESRAKRELQLQNTRIRRPSGEEWRLHAAPGGEGGELRFQLFQVARDGLPEAIAWPKELEGLSTLSMKKIDQGAIDQFLAMSEVPGKAVEIEKHEAWSFRDQSGAQIIWSDDRIINLQAFMRGGLLTCAADDVKGTVLCQCMKR